MTRIKLWKTKLKALKVEARQWDIKRTRAEKALVKLNHQITLLERKIELKLAQIEQGTSAHDGRTGAGPIKRGASWTQANLDIGAAAPPVLSDAD